MSKLIETLKLLDKSELQGFTRFMHSPYFCQHQQTIDFFGFLIEIHPDWDQDLFVAYSLKYPNTKISKARFNVLKSYLLGHLHNFLVQERFKSDPIRQKILLVDVLREREHFQQAGKQLEQAQREWEENTPLDSSNYLNRLLLEECALDLSFSVQNRSASPPIHQLLNAVDQTYIGYWLKYLLSSWTLGRMVGFQFPEDRWQEIRGLAEAQLETLPALARMHYRLLLLYRNEAPTQQYDALASLLEDHGQRMTKTELLNVYGNLQNYHTRRMHEGDPEAMQKLFLGYQQMVRLQLIFNQGEFTSHFIRNITAVACRLGEIAWTTNFLNTCRTQIVKEIGRPGFLYSLAYLDFTKGDFSKALQRLHSLEFVDPFYRIGHQTLLLRIYYELEQYESLDLVSETFRRYLNRTPQISDRQKEQYRAFISILKKLARAREKGANKARLSRITDLLEQHAEVTDRTWLSAKLEELSSPSSP